MLIYRKRCESHIDVVDIEIFTLLNLPFQIASIFYYLCVVTLQYVAPILMCLYFALMYKTLGGYSWTHLFANNTNLNITNSDKCPVTEPIAPTTLGDPDFDDEPLESLDKTILESAKELQSSFHGLKAVSGTIRFLVFVSTSKVSIIFYFACRYSPPMCIVAYSDLRLGGHALCGLQHRRWE